MTIQIYPSIFRCSAPLARSADLFQLEKPFRNFEAEDNVFKLFIKSKDTQCFNKRIDDLVSRWQKCVRTDGAYFNSFLLVVNKLRCFVL